MYVFSQARYIITRSLTCKAPITNAVDNSFFIFFFLIFQRKLALTLHLNYLQQTIHMKCQDSFFLKNKNKL